MPEAAIAEALTDTGVSERRRSPSREEHSRSRGGKRKQARKRKKKSRKKSPVKPVWALLSMNQTSRMLGKHVTTEARKTDSMDSSTKRSTLAEEELDSVFLSVAGEDAVQGSAPKHQPGRLRSIAITNRSCVGNHVEYEISWWKAPGDAPVVFWRRYREFYAVQNLSPYCKSAQKQLPPRHLCFLLPDTAQFLDRRQEALDFWLHDLSQTPQGVQVLESLHQIRPAAKRVAASQPE